MCIVIDTNTLGNVFDEENEYHNDFKPVKDWIINGKGKIVYGGTRYLEELGKYRKIFALYNAARKAHYINNAEVDEDENFVSEQIQHPNFDDQHLVALLRVSGCKLICSLDERAYEFFRHETFFNPARKRPKIYNQLSCQALLNDRNIARICKPCDNTTNAQRAMIGIDRVAPLARMPRRAPVSKK